MFRAANLPQRESKTLLLPDSLIAKRWHCLNILYLGALLKDELLLKTGGFLVQAGVRLIGPTPKLTLKVAILLLFCWKLLTRMCGASGSVASLGSESHTTWLLSYDTRLLSAFCVKMDGGSVEEAPLYEP